MNTLADTTAVNALAAKPITMTAAIGPRTPGAGRAISAAGGHCGMPARAPAGTTAAINGMASAATIPTTSRAAAICMTMPGTKATVVDADIGRSMDTASGPRIASPTAPAAEAMAAVPTTWSSMTIPATGTDGAADATAGA